MKFTPNFSLDKLRSMFNKEILNRVQNDNYGDLADCQPCKSVDHEEILNRVQNDSYEDLAVCKSRRLDDMKKTKTSRKKVAFTLAEVLITIGIIGIVAAITLPTLHTKITKVVLKNQIKKAMSQVNQGYKMALDEVGSIYDGKTNNSYGDFNKAFLNTFKLARICNGNGLKNNCVPEYEGLNVSGCLPFADNQVYNYRKIYITLSGVILISYDLDVGSLWLIDVNGMKGPNKAGWDLFLIDLGKETRPIWSGSNCINQGKIKGSITSSDMSFKTLADW